MSCRQALDLVMNARPTVRINLGFVAQLLQYERKLGTEKKSSSGNSQEEVSSSPPEPQETVN